MSKLYTNRYIRKQKVTWFDNDNDMENVKTKPDIRKFYINIYVIEKDIWFDKANNMQNAETSKFYIDKCKRV